MLSAKQTPKDGIGQEKTLYGQGVRLKAKDLTKTTSTTLKITGMTSGAVWYVDLLVKGEGDGKPVRFSPPSTGKRTPVINLASFEARNNAAFATSQADPCLPRRGTCSSRICFNFSLVILLDPNADSIAFGVSIKPGKIALTRIP